MNFHDQQHWIIELLDGRMEAHRRDAAAHHLRTCERCQQEVDLHRRSFEALDLLPAGGLSEARADALARNALVQARARPGISPWQRPSLRWVAAALVVVTSGWALWRGLRGDGLSAERQALDDQALFQNEEFLANFELIQDLAQLEEMGEVLDLEEEQLFVLAAL